MILETERLFLRSITLDDALEIYEYAKNKNVSSEAGFKAHESVEETKSIIETILIRDSLAIIYKANNKLIGTITLQKKLDDIYEIGYSLAEEYWNKGLMTEAVKELVRYAFMDLGAYEIDAGCFVDNYRSEKVLLKNKFKFMGIHEKDFLNYDNKYKDGKRFRLLKTDYMEG